MILEIKRYFDYARKNLFHRNRLNFLILYITSKCNLSCGSCFFHQNLNQPKDLSLEEYEKIASSITPFSILALAGGEPFLNPDLEKICALFVEKGKIDTLFIPTNGTFPEQIAEKTERLLKKFPDISLSINPSLDGLADYHDRNRGSKGTFEKCNQAIEKLTELKKKYKNLQVIVNTVISQDNLEEMEKLMEFLKKYALDFQAFELIRGNFPDKNLILPNIEEIKKIHQKILKNRHYYLTKNKSRSGNKLFFLVEEIMTLGVLRYSQKFKELALAGKRWPLACPAGRTIFVINPDGNFGACELQPPLADLKQFDFNLKRLLKNEEVSQAIETIGKKKCDCTHICFIHSAIAGHPPAIFKIISSYFQAKKIIKKC